MVDDEECIADTLAFILRSSGYDAGSVHDGKSALHECERWTPDLVISDVVMPGVNGIDLAIAIRERYPACKILLISGLGASFDLVEQASRKGHSFEILAKPIRPIELLSRITAVLTDDDFPRFTEERYTTGERPALSFGGGQSEFRDLKTGT
ncbi:MAG TPA: response regulator [Terracidiphilus sp.]|nr:response regulator [Terracidiphilus sp.]